MQSQKQVLETIRNSRKDPSESQYSTLPQEVENVESEKIGWDLV